MSDDPVTLPSGTEIRRHVRLRRRFDASPERVFRAWSDPEELIRWFPTWVEGSLVAGSRTTLVWPDQRVWWDVVAVEPNSRFVFRWPWGADEKVVTTCTVTLRPAGYGVWLELEDGPFDLAAPGGLDAWAEALEGWGEALTMLRAQLDFSVDVRHG